MLATVSVVLLAAVPVALSASASAAQQAKSATAGEHAQAGVVTPRLAATQDAAITGTYFWNADGYTGTLVIAGQNQGVVAATLYDNGWTESLSGTWDNNARILHLTRPIWNGADSQYYTFVLGGTPNEPTPQMFGGYFTQTNTGGYQYGAYLDSVH
jgi:hypothetical protein